MGENFKTCDLHGKTFPQNAIDTDEHEMTKLYAERTMTIEGKKTKMVLFIGKADSEGVDSCIECLTERILEVIKASGKSFSWKNVVWVSETMTKKDGSGTYQKNTPVVKSIDEIAVEIKNAKQTAGTK